MRAPTGTDAGKRSPARRGSFFFARAVDRNAARVAEAQLLLQFVFAATRPLMRDVIVIGGLLGSVEPHGSGRSLKRRRCIA